MNIRLYAYLDISDPMVAWEVAIGRIRSASVSPRDVGISIWCYGLLRQYATVGVSKKIVNEYKLELVRARFFPQQVSRLQGVYFFQSENDAYAAIERWEINKENVCVSAIDFRADKITYVDSEWITWCLDSDLDDWMHHYWSGIPCGVKPLTEVLGIGIGNVLDKNLRIQAYKKIYDLWPQSTFFLAVAACAYCFSSLDDVGMTRPFISLKDGVLRGSFLFYEAPYRKNAEELSRAIDECKKNGCLPAIHRDAMQGETLKIPDMRELFFEISSSQFDVLADILNEINRM